MHALATAAEEASTHKLKVCTKCRTQYAVKQRQPTNTLCPECKGSEADRSKRRRASAKEKVAAELLEASAGAAEEYHLKVGREDNLAAQHQDGLRDLVDTLVAMRYDPSSFDTIGAKYRELTVPMPDQEECQPGNYKLFDAIVARNKPFHRLTRDLPFQEIVADGLAASRASAKVYFGTVPFVLHHAGVIYANLGQGGVLGRGQPVHVDVMLPELVLFHYILGGVATNVYTPPDQLDAVALSTEMKERTGFSIGNLSFNAPSRHHLYYHTAAPLMQPDVLEHMRPASSTGIVEPGDTLRVIGSWPHAGGPLTAQHPYRMLLFSVATPVRTRDPYQGYVQVLVGEPEVAWAVLAKTPEQREAAKRVAYAALLRNADHYKYHSIKIEDGPLGKLLEAMLDGDHEQATLRRALEWMAECKVWVAQQSQLKLLWKVSELQLTPLKKIFE